MLGFDSTKHFQFPLSSYATGKRLWHHKSGAVAYPLKPLYALFSYISHFLFAWWGTLLGRIQSMAGMPPLQMPAFPYPQSEFAREDKAEQKTESTQDDVAFTLGVIALAAKVVQADGVETQDEYKAFCKAFPMPNSERAKVRRLFCSALADKSDAVFYARHLASLYPERQKLYTEVIARLFAVAQADGPVNIAEFRCICTIATALGVSDTALLRIGRSNLILTEMDAYSCLGVEQAKTFAHIKQRYHAAMRACHPDTLSSKLGQAHSVLEQEWLKLLGQQAVVLTGAYQSLSKGMQ